MYYNITCIILLAEIRVLVDGGCNRWIKWLASNNIDCHCDVSPPTLLTGDMDSIDKELLSRFRSNGTTEVIYTPNQNETDFTKAVREIKKYADLHDVEVK